MEKIEKVYSAKKRYFSAQDFTMELPGEQPVNESSLKKERDPRLDKADKFAEVIWKPTDKSWSPVSRRLFARDV